MFDQLEQFLLAHGGTEVEPACCDDHASLHPALIDRGEFIKTIGRIMVPGEKGKCHVQAGRLTLEQENLTLMCGYALAHDRWYIHSWAVDEENTIYETTCCDQNGAEKPCYERYYGIRGWWEDGS